LAAVGRLPGPALVPVALAAGLFNPAVTGGWTAQLPRPGTGRGLDHGSTLDAPTLSVARLARPGPAAPGPARARAPAAALAAAALVVLAIPAARTLRPYAPEPEPGPAPDAHRAGPRRTALHQMALHQMALHRQMANGFAVIAANRALRRATVTSVVSYAGI